MAGAARLTRLKRRAQFLQVAGKGRKLGRGTLLVQVLEGGGDDATGNARLGFTATKKLGNAVTRNRAKRRMREAARLELGAAPAPGHDIVLVAREAIREAAFGDIRADLVRALDKLGVKREGP
ncbi:ribonuclease P protein component [Rhodovarius crocodyli]|uniref:Ribonuclease P protein component n=1 Tax=Rhodovarius crocodyli TaxID=1979269 RepID=A0A437MEY4_9PROT|nr:ribonuclease P protein component [Rhodovarius crocodyli]RVT96175.1 ribonuclease P protein component [Rhodovarius crocodyli]